jgi:hypothetical protein
MLKPKCKLGPHVRQARAHQALGRTAKAHAILERVVAQFADTPSAAEAAGILNSK